mmetsp:Transcript_77234/g.201033  ORF Transcript_77234/g.201033 Transcript_77234/m.201033 type:complete len:288 (+) Transcript_77234:156-1019(+)
MRRAVLPRRPPPRRPPRAALRPSPRAARMRRVRRRRWAAWGGRLGRGLGLHTPLPRALTSWSKVQLDGLSLRVRRAVQLQGRAREIQPRRCWIVDLRGAEEHARPLQHHDGLQHGPEPAVEGLEGRLSTLLLYEPLHALPCRGVAPAVRELGQGHQELAAHPPRPRPQLRVGLRHLAVVPAAAVRERHQEPRVADAEREGDLQNAAEVDEAKGAGPRIDEDVPGVWVGVEEAIHEDLVAEDLPNAGADAHHIESRNRGQRRCPEETGRGVVERNAGVHRGRGHLHQR